MTQTKMIWTENDQKVFDNSGAQCMWPIQPDKF